MAESDKVVTIENLHRRFDRVRAVDGLDLEVARGECLGLLGPNGAGKSTTIRVLATLLAPSEGRVRVLGFDPTREAGAVRERIGVVPQELALYEHLTGRENLTFFGRLRGLAGGELAERVEAGLDLAGLGSRADDRVGTYSGGMMRRLNLAIALLHGPELLFLDEPTVGIDPQSRGRVYEMVESRRAEGVTMIYTSHQLGEVERLCDRIVILDRGKKIAEGTLAELQGRNGARSGAARLEFASEEQAREAARACAESGLACELREDLPDLEEVFLALTGRGLRDEAEP